MADPVFTLAMQRVVSASHDIEAQLRIRDGCRPVLIMLLRARNDAATAMAALALMPTDVPIERLREQQNEVKRYADILEWLRGIVNDGFEYERDISEQEREEMLEQLLRSPEGEHEAQELGLLERTEHA